MKKLSQFLVFDWNAFAKDKRFLCVGGGEWVDFETKAHKGTKIEVVITTDHTPYKLRDGEVVSNRFEKLAFKVAADVDIPIDQYVEPTGVTAKVYGDYRNLLSVEAGGITVQPKKP